MLMQTKPQSALAYDISALSIEIQLQIIGNDHNRSLFSRFPDKLLGIDTNAKTIKGEKYGIKTAILYLMPAMGSGVQLCANAKIAGCEKPCLFTAGRGAMSNVMLSRLRKTLYFNQYREQFMAQLSREITLEKANAKRRGYKLVVRLNGTSDIRWENIKLPLINAPRFSICIMTYNFTIIQNWLIAKTSRLITI